jgi:GT2 family glycosyltransferase/glycosyltransferase involved in cell wall biosynthesis
MVDSPPVNRVIVVVGMHRGGTSATTLALRALGVELGDDLLAADPDQNPIGFFEDNPLLEVSEQVLQVLDMKWDTPRVIPPQAWNNPVLGALAVKASASIRDRFDEFPVWGFKNPRTARLLPFWKTVFQRCEREASYVIALRNPISIATSLRRRNQIAPARAHLLWLLHMAEAVVHTRGESRVVVDYDELLLDPRTEFRRIAGALSLPFPDTNAIALLEAESALDTDHRRTQFDPADLEIDHDVSELSREAFTLLQSWSRDDPKTTPAGIDDRLGELLGRVHSLEPVLRDLAETDRARIEATTAVEAQRTALAGMTAERERLNSERAQLATDLHEQINHREAERVRMDALVNHSTQNERALHEAKTQTAKAELRAEQLGMDHELQRARADKLESERAGLQHSLAKTKVTSERERAGFAEQIARLSTSVEEERTRTEDLTLELGDRNATIQTLGRNLDQLGTEHEHITAVLSEERAQRRAWVRQQATILTREFTGSVDAMAVTRQWRLAARIQQGLSRAKLRPWINGMDQLQALSHTLHAAAHADPMDVKQLSVLARNVKQTFHELSTSTSFQFARALSRLAYLPLRQTRPEGPFEFVRNRISELHFHLSHLADLPDVPREAQTSRKPTSPTVDVVIPVYRAPKETLRCLDSVLASRNRTQMEIIVIDDASSHRALTKALEALERLGQITLLRNEQNLGFPGTANRGLMLHPDRDVVLLNSDTIVHGDWLDRLRRSATSDWRIATVTPFSNNAEICSYPVLCRPDPMPSASELAELDDAAAQANDGLVVTLPTAVGFCMYVRREVLLEIGGFDTERFGRGYGEENDFCLRARRQGYRNVLAGDVFVGHEGGASFTHEKQQLIDEGLAELDQLYPDYRSEINDFLERDPVRRLRRRIDVGRARRNEPAGILMVNHSRGGGTSQHVTELATTLEAEGTAVWTLQPNIDGSASLGRFDGPDSENLIFKLPDEMDGLIETARNAGVQHIHFHHLLGFDPSVREIPAALSCEFDITLHDFMVVCPRIHLIGGQGKFCGLPDAETCTNCVKCNGSEAGFEVDVEAWRAEHQEWLLGARRVFVPSQDTKEWLEPKLDGITLSVRPHAERFNRPAPPAKRGGRKTKRRRVAVIGAIGTHKGSELLHACALDAERRDLALEFHLVGFSDRDDLLRDTGRVSITGAYAQGDLPDLLRNARCDLAFLPSIWPETYCYTLSAAFSAGLFSVALDLGAIAERIRKADWGDLLPADSDASAINDRLIAVSPSPLPSHCSMESLVTNYGSALADYYDDLTLER